MSVDCCRQPNRLPDAILEASMKLAEASLKKVNIVHNQRDTDLPMASTDSPPAAPVTQTSLLRADDLLVDFERRSVRRGSQRLDLTDRSFRLLEALIRHAPEQVGKDQLIAEGWDDAVVSDETLAQRVRLLRQSLGDDSQNPRYIASVRGRGYRWVATVGEPGAVPARRRWRWGGLELGGHLRHQVKWNIYQAAISGYGRRPEHH